MPHIERKKLQIKANVRIWLCIVFYFPLFSGTASCVRTADTVMCHSGLAQPCYLLKGRHCLGLIFNTMEPQGPIRPYSIGAISRLTRPGLKFLPNFLKSYVEWIASSLTARICSIGLTPGLNPTNNKFLEFGSNF